MAEEFSEFMEKLNSKSLEDQLTELKGVVIELKGVVNNMVDLIHKFIDNYTNELSIIYNKINSIETKALDCACVDDVDTETKLTTLPIPPPPQARPIGNENVRTLILGELKSLFNKQKEMMH